MGEETGHQYTNAGAVGIGQRRPNRIGLRIASRVIRRSLRRLRVVLRVENVCPVPGVAARFGKSGCEITQSLSDRHCWLEVGRLVSHVKIADYQPESRPWRAGAPNEYHQHKDPAALYIRGEVPRILFAKHPGATDQDSEAPDEKSDKIRIGTETKTARGKAPCSLGYYLEAVSRERFRGLGDSSKKALTNRGQDPEVKSPVPVSYGFSCELRCDS